MVFTFQQTFYVAWTARADTLLPKDLQLSKQVESCISTIKVFDLINMQMRVYKCTVWNQLIGIRLLKYFVWPWPISNVKSPICKNIMQRDCQSAMTFYGTTLLDHWMHLNVIATVCARLHTTATGAKLLFFSLSAKAWCHRRHVGASTNQRQERPDTASKQDWTASNNGWKLKTLCRKICHYCDIIWNLCTKLFPKEMYSGGAPKTNLVFIRL